MESVQIRQERVLSLARKCNSQYYYSPVDEHRNYWHGSDYPPRLGSGVA